MQSIILLSDVPKFKSFQIFFIINIKIEWLDIILIIVLPMLWCISDLTKFLITKANIYF